MASYPILNAQAAAKSKGRATPGRHYFWLREHIDTSIRNVELGILFALPLVAAFFSTKYASAIIAIEATAYYIGLLISAFDLWYNREYEYSFKEEKEQPQIPNPTELDTILDRINTLEYEYSVSLDQMYYFVLINKIPYSMDNLDWLEMVSLLNQLSLQMGKHFEEIPDEGEKKL